MLGYISFRLIDFHFGIHSSLIINAIYKMFDQSHKTVHQGQTIKS